MSEILAPIKQRILQFIEYKGLKKGEFFSLIDVSPSNFRSKSLQSEVGGDVIAKISSYFPDVNLKWLLTGEGCIPLGEISSMARDEQCQNYTNEFFIPVYNAEASAGGGALTLSSEFVVDKIKVPFAREGDSALTIVGNSMTPILNSGDLVVVRQLINWREYIEYGKIFIIVTIDEVFCKVVHKSNEQSCFTLHSYNNSYDDFDVSLKFINNMYKVVGVVSQRSF